MYIEFSRISTKQKYLDVDYHVTIEPGDKVAIMGVNGCGKSSLINALLGAIKTDNDIVCNLKDNEIGLLPQKVHLLDKLSVKQYIELVNGAPLTNEELETSGIKHLYNRPIKVLSGGEAQYLALYLTTKIKRKLYIFDELTTGLDASKHNHVINNLINKNIDTFMLVTHYCEEAIKTCKKLLLMDNGNIICYDDIDNLISKLGLDYKVIDQDHKCRYYSNLEDAKVTLNENEFIQPGNLQDVLNHYGVVYE